MKAALLMLGVVVLVGCSGGSAADKALDTASPMANVPSPPAPANKPRMHAPGAIGSPAGPRAK